ncbi:MAG: DUF192 domain-containing protein [Myxococcales bacterium]|nr:DUF192 domain-containing protein [Myxococcales bacterium]
MTALFLLGCAGAHPAETRDLNFGTHVLHVRVADAPKERAAGLMGVTDLAPDAGMVFAYPAASPRFFWMKDTPTPLSIAFCDAKGVIVTIADLEPLDTTLTPSHQPAMYAVEANKGWFAAHGVAVGDLVGGLPGPAPK